MWWNCSLVNLFPFIAIQLPVVCCQCSSNSHTWPEREQVLKFTIFAQHLWQREDTQDGAWVCFDQHLLHHVQFNNKCAKCVCFVLNQNSQKALDICNTLLPLFSLFIAILLGFIDSCFSLSLLCVCSSVADRFWKRYNSNVGPEGQKSWLQDILWWGECQVFVTYTSLQRWNGFFCIKLFIYDNIYSIVQQFGESNFFICLLHFLGIEVSYVHKVCFYLIQII